MNDLLIQIKTAEDKYGLFAFKLEDSYLLIGKLNFSASLNEMTLTGSYDLNIEVPFQFPNVFPIVKEIGNKISRDFHIKNDDSLCLGTDADIQYNCRKHFKVVTICNFIDGFVIPYLYSYEYFLKYGFVPQGERSHSGGIWEFYVDVLGCDVLKVNKILKYIVNGNINVHHDCPCGSGKKIFKCHKKGIKELIKYVDIEKIRNNSSFINNKIENYEKNMQSEIKAAAQKILDDFIIECSKSFYKNVGRLFIK